MLKHTGKITLSRYQSNGAENDIISIKLVDETSGTQTLEINLTPHVLGMILTGLAMQECTFELYGVDSVGKVRETMRETIHVAGKNQPNAKQIISEYQSGYRVAPEGWTLALSPSQRIMAAETLMPDMWLVEVPFVRYVEKQRKQIGGVLPQGAQE